MKAFPLLLLKYSLVSIPAYAAAFMLIARHEQHRYGTRIDALTVRAQYNMQTAAAHLTDKLDSALTDLLFLSDGFEYDRLDDPVTFKQISGAYFSFARTTGKYERIRFMDTTGQEIIRVDLRDNGPELIPAEQLQNNVHRAYVRPLLRAEKNQLYISPLDLNAESGQIEAPHKPVLRLGRPVFAGSQRIGMVVLNYMATPLLDSLADSESCRMTLINQDGRWLKALNPDEERGLQLKHAPSFKSLYPHAWQEICTKKTGRVDTPDNTILFQTLEPFGQTASPDRSPASWILACQLRPEVLASIRSELSAQATVSKTAVCGGVFLVTLMLALTQSKTRKASRAVQKSEGAYRDLLDNMLSGFALHEMLYDEQGHPQDYRFLQVNKSYEELTGLDAQKLMGHTVKTVLPDTEDYWLHTFDDVMKSGRAVRVEHYSQALGKYLEVSAYKVSPSEFATFVKDVTLTRHAREALEIQANEMQSIFNTTGAGIILADTQGTILDANPAFEKILGYSRQEVIGTAYTELVPDEFCLASKERLAQLQKGESIDGVEGKARAKDGRIVTIMLNEHPIFGKTREPVQFVLSLMDISERKKMEERLLANEQRCRFLSDAAREGVILCQGGQIIEANQPFFGLTGKTEEDLQNGLRLESIMNPALLRADETVTININRSGADAAQPIVAEVSLMHHVLQGEIVDVLVIRDVSAQKEAEEMLVLAKMRAEATSRAKSEFLTTMSHELRTPMNGIMGMTQLMLDTELNTEQNEYVNIIYDSSRALLEIINDLLDLAGIENGKVTLVKAPLDLRETASQVVELLSHQVRSKQLEIAFTYDPGLPREFTGDEGRIRQILLNLMGNAVKFTDAGCVRLAINTEAVSDEGVLVRIEVSDTGIGIPQEKIDLIFEKFTQVDQSDTRRYEGTGLGLNITKRLVELMDGSLSCESIINQGSTFTVILPLPQWSDEPQEATEPRMYTLPRPLNILLAEDNLTNRITAEHLLQKMGCTTLNAVNGKEALEMAIERPFDLILMDLKMPEMNGLEATVRLRAAGIKIPIIAITAHAMESDRQTCIAAGMNDYLAKPIEQETLFRVLEKIAKA